MPRQSDETVTVQLSQDVVDGLERIADECGAGIDDVCRELVFTKSISLPLSVHFELEELSEAYRLDLGGAVTLLLQITRQERRDHLMSIGREQYTRHIPADHYSLQNPRKIALY